MGFMAGFGPAFADSFGRAREKRVDQENDIFKMTYQDFLQKKGKFEERREKDSQYSAQAKLLASQTDNPEDSYHMVYDSLRKGISTDYLQDFLKNNKVVVDKTNVSQQVQKETTDMLNPDAAKKVYEEVVQTPEELARANAAKKIAETTGQSLEEVNSIMNFKTSESESSVKYQIQKMATTENVSELPDLENIVYARDEALRKGDTALAQKFTNQIAAQRTAMDMTAISRRKESGNDGFKSFATIGSDGVFTGSTPLREVQTESGIQYVTYDGKVADPSTIKPVSEDFHKNYIDLSSKYGKATEIYYTKLSDTSQFVKGADDLRQMVEENPEILASVSAIPAAVDRVITEIGVIEKTIESQLGTNDTEGYKKSLEQYETKLNGLLSDENKAIAVNRDVFDAKARLLAYRHAAMYNQEGRSLSNADFQGFLDTIKGSTRPEVVIQKLTDYSQDAYNYLEGERQIIVQNNMDVKSFEKLHGVKTGFEPSTLEQHIMSANDGRLKQAFDKLQPPSAVRPSSVKVDDGSSVNEVVNKETITGKLTSVDGRTVYNDISEVPVGSTFIGPDGITYERFKE